MLLSRLKRQPRVQSALLLICRVAGKRPSGTECPQEPPVLMPVALCPAAVRPAPVCAPAAVLGDDGDHPDPPGGLPHPLQLRGVCGALPCAPARGEARLQAGIGLAMEIAGGEGPALGWARALVFSWGWCAGLNISSAT